MKLTPTAKRYLKIALTIALLAALLLSLDVSRFAAALFRVDAGWMAAGIHARRSPRKVPRSAAKRF